MTDPIGSPSVPTTQGEREANCVDADAYRKEVDRLRGLLGRSQSRLAEIKAICFAADHPDSERYTEDQAGLVHLIADIRDALEATP